MAKHAKRFHDGAYSGLDERRELEHEDFEMIPRGGGEFANMPSQVIHKKFAEVGGWTPEPLDDTLRGVDNQMREDNSEKHRGMKPKKS